MTQSHTPPPQLPQVCFRGPCCTKGYYKDPENTKNLFDEDGWLRTGDIGQFNAVSISLEEN